MDSPDAAPPPSDPSLRARSRRQHAGSAVRVGPSALLAHALLLGGATAAVFMAGGTPQGTLGVFLLCAGVAMIACPPLVKVEWRLWLAAGAVLGCCALALLPEHAVPQPAWRRAFDSTPPIVMPGTISTAPALTVFWLTLLAISLLVGLFLLAQPIRSRWLLVFVLAAALAAGTYGALAIYAQTTGRHYLPNGGATFGFFPNRNHTATFLFVGALLAVGILGVVLREERWLAGLLAAGVMSVCVAGLVFYSPTRAGIVFLLAGLLLWLAGLGRRHRDRRVVVSFMALLLAGGVLFVVSGGEVRDRLLGQRTTPPTAPVATTPGHDATSILSGDLRHKIYLDTFALIRDFPGTGIGLGTFAFVFPQYRQASRCEATTLHPESDWIMFAAEAGLPATLCLVVLLALAAGRLKAERDHPYWPLRLGCAVAAGAAVLHGMVDVPVHNHALAWWVLVIAGLALQSARAGTGGRSRAQHALFIVGGVATLAQGGSLVRAEWFGGPPSALFTYGAAQTEYSRLARSDPERAVRLAQQTARAHPMEESAYLSLGGALGRFEDTRPETDAAYRAERLIEPILTDTPLNQGKTWLNDDPVYAAALWSDALTRCTRNDQIAGVSTYGSPLHFFATLIGLAATRPAAQNALWKETDRGPEYAFVWVESATPPEARAGINRLAADEGFLRGLDATGQRRFLRDWYRHGDTRALTGFLDGRAGWQATAWPVRLQLLADAQQYERAFRDGAEHYGITLILPEPGSGDAVQPSTDQENDDPAAAVMAYWKTGNVRSARRVLDEAVTQPRTTQFAELWRLKTAMAAHDADWPTAWSSLQREIVIIHPEDTL